MRHVYFADPWIGWVFYLVLMGLLAIASYTDWRRMVIPKWVTLPTLALGVAANIVRGALLGHRDLPGWALATQGAGLGGLDGLLFALAGFTLGFGLFVVLWGLGTCGGGDVKLMAALGAWIGPTLLVEVTAVTLFLVFIMTGAKLVSRLLSGRLPLMRERSAHEAERRAGALTPGSRLTSYAAAVALAAGLVLVVAFRVDLGLAQAPAPVQEAAHAR
jgi:prepilin peptidase CpaA